MPKYYDSSLRGIFPANNNYDGPVLNKNFSYWTGLIEESLERIPTRKDSFYKKTENAELLKNCKEHVKTYRKSKDNENIVSLVHPFYLYHSHMDELNKKTRRDADEYKELLMEFIQNGIPRDIASVVLLETLHHYAASTSLLLETGMVDDVFFTLYDRGLLLNKSDISDFSGRSVFAAGGYNYRCFDAAIEEINEAVQPGGGLWGIKPLILNSPLDFRHSLKPNSRDIYELKKSNLISIKEAVRIMKDPKNRPKRS